jgi:hypothetical protein
MESSVFRRNCLIVLGMLSVAGLCFPAGPQAPAGQDAGGAAEKDSASGNGGQEWPLASVKLGVLLDGYYSANFNRPESGRNQLRNFDVSSHALSLNMAKLVLESPAEPLGFRMDLGFGRALELIHGAESSPEIMRHVLQAFVTYRPAKDGGLTLDFGKFVTAAGAEVVETNSNWNYSRSLLFALAIPYYHFGVRATAPLGRYFNGGVAVVNGWNNVEDNNRGKTVGIFGTLSGAGVSWTNCYYGGPEKPGVSQGWRHLYDTTLLLTPHSRASMYVNFDYGREGVATVRRDGADLGLPGGRWVGVAGAARLAVNRWFALAPRVEWFHDADGLSTGTAQKLKEFTLTGEFKLAPGVITRVEFRRDWSNQPFFERRAGEPLSKQQSTVLVGLLAFFGVDNRVSK